MSGSPLRYVEGLPTPARCLVMGVLNVTPDSFSDGGRYQDPGAAVAHGLQLVAQGADLVDVGGESTRPGASRVEEAEELARVIPVVARLADAGVVVSVDTMRARVAEHAVAAGARLVNDVSGGRADPEMLATLARLRVPYVLMHWRAHAATMQRHTGYDDVVAEVHDELARQLALAEAAGIDLDLVAVDPGVGFAKTPEQSWRVLGALERLHDLGRPLLVAASRKRLLGALLAEEGDLRPPSEREDATTATSALAAAAGAWCVRVHAVRANADAVRVAAAWGGVGPAPTTSGAGGPPGGHRA